MKNKTFLNIYQSPKIRTICGMLFFLALMLILPPIAQDPHYHEFADKTLRAAIPNAFDVLSNLAYGAAGLLGFLYVFKNKGLDAVLKLHASVLCAGLVLTCLGSGYYHWAPTNETLFWDRLPMTIAFSGLFGLLAYARVSKEWSIGVLLSILIVGPGSTVVWAKTQNLTPYIIVQFGGLLWLLLAWLSKRKVPLVLPWGLLMFWYLVAKLCETWDHQIYHLLFNTVSGHTLKHLTSAWGAYVFVRAFKKI